MADSEARAPGNTLLDRRREAVKALLREWAYWRDDRRHINRTLGYGRSIFGKLLDGMPTGRCPHCRGNRVIPLPLYDGNEERVDYIDCPLCSGTGRVSGEATAHKVNPATIRSTRPGGGVSHRDNAMSEIDQAVVRLIPRQRRVLMAHYCRWHHLMVEDKAKRLGVSKSYYYRLLAAAHTEIVRSADWRVLNGG